MKKNHNTFERGVNMVVLTISLFCGIATIGAQFHCIPWHWLCLCSLAYLILSKANQFIGAMSEKAKIEQQPIPVEEKEDEKQEEKKPVVKPRSNIDVPVP